MTYRRLDQVGTTKRKPISDAHATRLWEASNGICINCNLPIDGLKHDWFVEHRIALELGGSNDDNNLGPAHYDCKAEKDAADHKAAGKAKRRKKAEIGIKAPAKKIDGPSFRPTAKRSAHPMPLPPRRSMFEAKP